MELVKVMDYANSIRQAALDTGVCHVSTNESGYLGLSAQPELYISSIEEDVVQLFKENLYNWTCEEDLFKVLGFAPKAVLDGDVVLMQDGVWIKEEDIDYKRKPFDISCYKDAIMDAVQFSGASSVMSTEWEFMGRYVRPTLMVRFDSHEDVYLKIAAFTSKLQEHCMLSASIEPFRWNMKNRIPLVKNWEWVYS